MPPATRDQADAHRYGMRRLEAALVRADPVPLHEQLRSQRRATVVGALLALLGLGAAALVAVVAPRPTWQDQALVVGTPSGSVYAVAHDPDRLVPVPDALVGRLALAALGTAPADPRLVPDTALADAPRTAPVELPGGTGVLLGGPGPAPRWGICGATVLAGTYAAAPAVPALWARSPAGTEYAVLDGVRHRLPADPTVAVGLGLVGGAVPVASAVLSALPEGPALDVPELPDGPGPAGVPGRPGDLLATTTVDGVRRLVAVVPGGVQEVPATLAEVLRARGGTGPREVAPAVVAEAPRRDVLPVAGWPEHTPDWAGGPVCAAWAQGRWDLVPADPLPVVADARTVGSVALGGGGAVRAVSPTGGGTIWLVATSGTVYGVADAETATALGIGPDVPEAPESLLRLLPQGGDLSVARVRAALPA